MQAQVLEPSVLEKIGNGIKGATGILQVRLESMAISSLHIHHAHTHTHTYLFRSPQNSPWPISPPHSHDLLLSSLANSLPLQRLTTYTTRIKHQAAVAGGFAATVMFPIGTPAGERGGLHSKESERERDTDRERDTVMQVRKKTGILICNETVRDSERE